MADPRMLDSLRRFQVISRSIQVATGGTSSPPKSVSVLTTSITFPPLPNTFLELRSIGLADQTAARLVDFFSTRCAQLQTFYRETLCEMLSHSSSAVHDSLRTTTQKIYADYVTQMHTELLHRVRLHCDRLLASTKSSRPMALKATFNHDYIPVLEKYFQYNAYPSSADRAVMARKSMMTERQIEVWFQNHRNRARKEGKTLPRFRSNEPLPPDLEFDALGEKMGDLVRPDDERLFFSNSDESDPESFEMSQEEESPGVSTSHIPTELTLRPLSPPRPIYAFPSPYLPPSVSFVETTRLTHHHFTFPAPTWPRRPSTSSNTVSGLTSSQLDDFADLFARLTVREEPSKYSRRRAAPLSMNTRVSATPAPSAANTNSSTAAATRAITTVLCSGRHPSFFTVPSTPKPVSVPTRQIHSVMPKAGQSSSCAPIFQRSQCSISTPPLASPSRPSSSILRSSPSAQTLSPTGMLTPNRKRRKSPQLPRRVPGSSPKCHPSSLNAPYHPYASISRASSSASLSSAVSTDSSGARSSSSSSTASSTPATPEQENISLPSLQHNSSSTTSMITLPLSPFDPVASTNSRHLNPPFPSSNTKSPLSSPSSGQVLDLFSGDSFQFPTLAFPESLRLTLDMRVPVLS